MKKIVVISLLLLFLASCSMSVNKSIRIEDGETVNHSLNTVNGSIQIGNSCEVFGDCRTINGSIKVGTNSRVTDLKTVNGSIGLHENVHVEGSLESVNGDIRCQQNVRVHRRIGTINGKIDLTETTVKEDITTYNGDITLKDGSLVEGDIIIKKPTGVSGQKRELDIRILNESVVNGNIRVLDENMHVRVHLSRGGKVNGRVENAEVLGDI